MECIFCKIVSGEIGSEKVYEDEEVLAFRDINPQAPVHILIIPKRHIENLMEADEEILKRLLLASKEVARREGIDGRGFRVAVNCGREGGQVIPHLHFHLIGGRELKGELG